jgi:hypothetical protein
MSCSNLTYAAWGKAGQVTMLSFFEARQKGLKDRVFFCSGFRPGAYVAGSSCSLTLSACGLGASLVRVLHGPLAAEFSSHAAVEDPNPSKASKWRS